MSNDDQLQQDDSQEATDKQNQTAVPYIPPPPPNAPHENSVKKIRSPLVNGMLAALAILLGGFMLYNYTAHAFTRLAGISDVKSVSPTPSSVPSISPSVSPDLSPSPEISPSPIK